MNNKLRLRLLLTDLDTGARFLLALALSPIEIGKMLYRYYPLQLAITLGAILRIPLLFSPLWYDEQFSLILSRLGYSSILAATAGDVHPPLYYFIITAWSNGPNWLIRIPSYLASIGAIYLLYAILSKLNISRGVASLAILLMAISPYQIYYASEARMYSILQFLILLAFLAGLNKDYLVMIIAGALACYTQIYASFYIIAIVVTLAIVNRAQALKALLAGLAVAMLWLPWYGIILSQQSRLASTGYWIPPADLGRLIIIIYQLINGPAMLIDFAPAGIFAICLILAWALIWLIKNKPTGWAPILAMAAIPILIPYSVSQVSLPILIARPLIAATPFIYTLLALAAQGLSSLSYRGKVLAAIFIAPIILTGSVILFRGYEVRDDLASKKALAYIASHWEPGDTIYHEQDGSAVYFKALAPGYKSYSYPPCLRIGSYISKEARVAMGLDELEPSKLNGRVWIVTYKFPYTPSCEIEDFNSITSKAKLELVLNEFNPNANFTAGELYLMEADK